MNVTDVVRRVRTLVGDSGGSFVQEPQLIDLINDAITDINLETKVLYSTQVIPTVDGTASYALAADFVVAKRVFMTGFGHLLHVPRNQIVYLNPSVGIPTVKGIPEYYSIEGPNILLYPTPNSVQSINVEYVRDPADLTAGGNAIPLPTYLHTNVVQYCYGLMKERDEDFEAAMSIKANALADAAMKVDAAQNSSQESYPVVRDIVD